MSWQAYVDRSLLESGKVSQGAILGHDGSIWAKSADLANCGELNKPSEECKAIAEALGNPADAEANGVTICGQKYLTLRAEKDDYIHGKKGKDGVVIYKTKTAILVGIYKDGIQPGECNKVVAQLSDYLKVINY